MVQELSTPPGECRAVPRYPVCCVVFLFLNFFSLNVSREHTDQGLEILGEGQHRHHSTSRSRCLRRQQGWGEATGAGELTLTWLMLGGGPRSFWLLGRGGADDIPKAVV